MKSALQALAVVLAASGLPAVADGDPNPPVSAVPAQPPVTAQPAAPAPATPSAGAPIASAVKSTGTDAEVEAGLVMLLNAEPSLQGSKIAVNVEQMGATLTGVTRTKEQRKKAAEIVASRLGVERVVNAILAEQV
jgi:hypothetical protein